MSNPFFERPIVNVVQPNDPDNYYGIRRAGLARSARGMKKARTVITNYHSFKRRDRMELFGRRTRAAPVCDGVRAATLGPKANAAARHTRADSVHGRLANRRP
jgi:hypothetical protein